MSEVIEGAIVKREESSPVVTTQRAIILRESLKEDAEQRALLARYVQQHMKEGIDYGTIPGTPKPTLYKPGAEKLVDLFRCTPKFALLTREEDFDRGFFNYMFRVRLVSRDSGAVLAEGFGSGNSREGRYRWRDAQRKCPNCGKTAIIKGRAEYGGGWVCFNKKGGCGTKWADGAPEIEKQALGKVENDDIATLANTILKMAKKRALVDGAIALARISDMFTQDVEDLADPSHADDAAPAHRPTENEPPPHGEIRAPRPVAKTAEAKPAPKAEPKPESKAAPGPMTDTFDKLRALRAKKLWGKAKATMTEEGFRSWVGGVLGADKSSKDWTPEDLDQLETALSAELAMGAAQ